MLVQVTAEHISKGQRDRTNGCPISLAIRDLGYEHVSTGFTSCTVAKTQGSDCMKVYKLPKAAQRFVSEFDYSHVVQPLQFILEE